MRSLLHICMCCVADVCVYVCVVCPSQDAAKIAKDSKVKIFTADIIYHLFDKFTKDMSETREEERKQLTGKGLAVFPVQLKIMPLNVFNKRNPVRCVSTSARSLVPPSASTYITSLLCPVFLPLYLSMYLSLSFRLSLVAPTMPKICIGRREGDCIPTLKLWPSDLLSVPKHFIWIQTFVHRH